MKGRRRARSVALQALYELDQSTHPLDVVLAARLEDLYRSGARSALVRADWAIVTHLVAHSLADGLDHIDCVAVADQLGVAEERVQAVLAQLIRLRPQADYCARVVRGVFAHREAIDRVVALIAPEWPVDQMAPIDRNVLRIALWELACETTPLRVVINEAVEIAREFSGEGARRMVNGALGAYAAGKVSLDLSDPRC